MATSTTTSPNSIEAKAKLRNVCFTWNNYPEDWADQVLQNLPVSYLLGAREKAPTTGTPHIQGYIQFKGQVYFSALKAIFPSWHVEKAKAGYQENWDYCTKSDPNPYTWGTPKLDPKKAKRTDLSTIKEIILRTGDIRQVIDIVENQQQLRFAQNLIQYSRVKRTEPPEVIYIWGPSGCGKSRLAAEMAPEAFWWSATKWWCGYCADEDVIIDDFRSDGDISMKYMLRLLDRYPVQPENKGGSIKMLAKRIIITCIFPPTSHYQIGDEPQTQWLRRISKIIFLGKDIENGKKVQEIWAQAKELATSSDTKSKTLS